MTGLAPAMLLVQVALLLALVPAKYSQLARTIGSAVSATRSNAISPTPLAFWMLSDVRSVGASRGA